MSTVGPEPIITVDQYRAKLRRSVYWLLILSSAATMVGRIWQVESSNGKTPFLSANDRSRWCTIRALVDHNTFVIDDVVVKTDSEQQWDTIDKVRHKGDDGREHFYSSKIPLLPILVAAEYWVIKNTTGAEITEHPFYVGRIILVVTNVLPMIVYLALLARVVERFGQTDWGRMFVMACACWGTFLTTFAVTLNNHLPAAISVLIATHAVLRIWCDGERRWRYFFVAGLFAAFAAVNELPALSFFAMIAVVLLVRAPLRTLVAFVPAAAIVTAAMLGTNYLAHDSWRPPYAHRQDGELLGEIDGEFTDELNRGEITPEMLEQLRKLDVGESKVSAAARIVTARDVKEQAVAPRWMFWKTRKAPVLRRWVLWDETSHTRLAIVRVADETTDAGNNDLEVRAWDNWYDYDGSYWAADERAGIDAGEPSRVVYATNMLVGHHGVFSLTPIWLLTVVGLGMAVLSPALKLRGFAIMVIVLTIVCVAFYVTRPLQDRNYGGISAGMRWLFWFIPLWLIAMLPAVDAMSSKRLCRVAALGLLVISVFSATFPVLNPWTHPWIYQYWESLGWIN